MFVVYRIYKYSRAARSRRLRAGLAHLVADLVLVQLERLAEHGRELAHLALEEAVDDSETHDKGYRRRAR